MTKLSRGPIWQSRAPFRKLNVQEHLSRTCSLHNLFVSNITKHDQTADSLAAGVLRRDLQQGRAHFRRQRKISSAALWLLVWTQTAAVALAAGALSLDTVAAPLRANINYLR